MTPEMSVRTLYDTRDVCKDTVRLEAAARVAIKTALLQLLAQTGHEHSHNHYTAIAWGHCPLY